MYLNELSQVTFFPKYSWCFTLSGTNKYLAHPPSHTTPFPIPTLPAKGYTYKYTAKNIESLHLHHSKTSV